MRNMYRKAPERSRPFPTEYFIMGNQPVERGHLTPPPSPYKTLKRMRIVPNFIAYPHPPQKISKNYCNLHKVRYTKAVK